MIGSTVFHFFNLIYFKVHLIITTQHSTTMKFKNTSISLTTRPHVNQVSSVTNRLLSNYPKART